MCNSFKNINWTIENFVNLVISMFFFSVFNEKHTLHYPHSLSMNTACDDCLHDIIYTPCHRTPLTIEVEEKVYVSYPSYFTGTANNITFYKLFQILRKQTSSFSNCCFLKPLVVCIMNANTSSCIPSVKILNGTPDIYQGVTINTAEINLSDCEFEEHLGLSIAEWNKIGVRGVWFRVNIENSSFIPILVKHGFQFHHAKASYAMLTRWLPQNEVNLLPQFPHTHIGVGGMVINAYNQVLVIKEKYPERKHWKFPGGYSNPGEDFYDTARREVFEETGIDTEFISLVSLRHHHQHIFDCSDIYAVCHLHPLTDSINFSKEEIAECQWMDICAFIKHPDVTDFSRFLMEAFLQSQRLKAAIFPTPVLSYRKDTHHQVYTVKDIKSSS